jgi:hypothetical protein
MSRINKIIGFVFSVTLVTVLALPALRWLDLRAPDGTLYGYTDEVPPPPTNAMRAFFDRSLQRWVEKYFEVNLGFRALLIRSFNELNFRFFREAPKLRLYTTSAHGLYSKMSIENLNDEVVRRKVLEERYRIEAEKLLRVQRQLQSQGKYFEVVIGTSKPYVYPDSLGTRYLVGGSAGIFDRAANFGNILREAGVNVIDGGPLLREFATRTGVETHPASGVHWNYYAGCLVARQLFENLRTCQFAEAPMLDCGEPRVAEPQMVDVDGLLLLNIWSMGGLAKPSPYPTIAKIGEMTWRPNIVFIGDSFSDQIRYALRQANAYSRMVMSGYFREREIDDRVEGTTTVADMKADESTIREALMKDIANSDVIVLQMVDYNVGRWGYGFADYILNYFSGGEVIH